MFIAFIELYGRAGLGGLNNKVHRAVCEVESEPLVCQRRRGGKPSGLDYKDLLYLLSLFFLEFKVNVSRKMPALPILCIL